MRFPPGLMFILVSLSAIAPCSSLAAPGQHSAEGRKGMVVSVSPLASEAGLAILKKGGNAVDAAVATALALAVTWPEAGNIGGGGFMLICPAGKSPKPVMIDYREKAPALASREMFAVKKPAAHLLVGVPGSVAGLALAHRKHGKLPWKDLVLPAITLADEGFRVDEALAKSLNQFSVLQATFRNCGGYWARRRARVSGRWGSFWCKRIWRKPSARSPSTVPMGFSSSRLPRVALAWWRC